MGQTENILVYTWIVIIIIIITISSSSMIVRLAKPNIQYKMQDQQKAKAID